MARVPFSARFVYFEAFFDIFKSLSIGNGVTVSPFPLFDDFKMLVVLAGTPVRRPAPGCRRSTSAPSLPLRRRRGWRRASSLVYFSLS